MKIPNIIRRGGREREREKGGYSNIKSLIQLEREDPKNKGKKK